MNENLFAPNSPGTCSLPDNILALIDKALPLPGRYRQALPENIAELSRLLTAGRGERSLNYLNQPPHLSAYLRYFLPWNLYRLCRLLPALPIKLAAHDTVTDLGCGPLTLTIALWMCRSDLRELPLEFTCIDQSGPALDAGKKLFAALAGDAAPWKIRTVKSGLNAAKIKPAALICAVNVCNEMYGDFSRCSPDDLRRNAEKTARLLTGYGTASSAFLVIEPGLPRSGEFISLLRNLLLQQGYQPVSPCPHNRECPAPGRRNRDGGKTRWCHFTFSADGAPASLLRLSKAAHVPKERAALSFLLAAPAFTGGTVAAEVPEKLRIISDPFPLPGGKYGRYGCTQHGLALLTGDKDTIEKTASGSLVNAVIKKDSIDPKSKAVCAEEVKNENHTN